MSKTIILNRFNEGIVNDPRLQREAVCRMSANFDVLTNSNKITPYRSSESGDSAASTSKKQNFAIALRSGTTYSLYALGVKSGAATAEVLYKDLTTGAANDLDDDSWAALGAVAKYQSSAGATNFELFAYYRKTGLIYGARAGTHIWAYDPTGAADFADTHQAVTYTQIGQGIVHSKDDILYIPYYNNAGAAGAKSFIATNNNGSWSLTALTLPDHLIPRSICEYNDYVAILCSPASGIGNSRVYLWDRNSSLTTVSESIDWGEGDGKIIEELEGVLIGISLSGANSTRFNNRILLKYYSSTYGAVKFGEILSSTTGTTALLIGKQKIDNRLYFMMRAYVNGTQRDGVWSIGRSSVDTPFALSHERTPNNDTAITTLYNFFIVGDYVFQSYDISGTFGLSKTDDAANYTATAVRETVINPGMPPEDRTKKKQLKAIAVSYEKMPAAGQCVIKYKVDGGSLTTIATETTDDIITTIRTQTASGQFTAGREYEFVLESTGGCEITELKYSYDLFEEVI